MKTRLAIFAIVFAAVLGGGCWFVLKAKDPKPVEPVSLSSASEGSSDNGIERLEAALAQMQERLRRIETKQTASGNQISSPVVAVEVPLPARPTAEQVQAKVAARIDTALVEPRDEPWAKKTEEDLFALANSVMPSDTKSGIKGLSCARNICRLEVSHTSPDDLNAFAQAFSSKVISADFDGASFQPPEETGPDGSQSQEILIFRKDSRLMASAEDYK